MSVMLCCHSVGVGREWEWERLLIPIPLRSFLRTTVKCTPECGQLCSAEAHHEYSARVWPSFAIPQALEYRGMVDSTTLPHQVHKVTGKDAAPKSIACGHVTTRACCRRSELLSSGPHGARAATHASFAPIQLWGWLAGVCNHKSTNRLPGGGLESGGLPGSGAQHRAGWRGAGRQHSKAGRLCGDVRSRSPAAERGLTRVPGMGRRREWSTAGMFKLRLPAGRPRKFALQNADNSALDPGLANTPSAGSQLHKRGHQRRTVLPGDRPLGSGSMTGP